MNTLILFFVSISFIFSNYNQFNQAFIDVSKEQSPAIVSIISEKTEKINDMFFFNPFENFGFNENPHQQERKAQSLGSGVIIDKNQGYIITNNHVIEGAEEIKVVLFDKREVKATIIATDPLSDIAVIKIDAEKNTINLMVEDFNYFSGRGSLSVFPYSSPDEITSLNTPKKILNKNLSSNPKHTLSHKFLSSLIDYKNNDNREDTYSLLWF